MRDKHGNQFRWELRWEWFWLRNLFRYPFFEFDSFLDGGTRFWRFGPLTVFRWYVHEDVIQTAFSASKRPPDDFGRNIAVGFLDEVKRRG